jgi:hypothetical protein
MPARLCIFLFCIYAYLILFTADVWERVGEAVRDRD